MPSIFLLIGGLIALGCAGGHSPVRRQKSYAGASVGKLGQRSVKAQGEHVIVHSYADADVQRQLRFAESIYEDVVSEIGAVEFIQQEPYRIFIFANRRELEEKSGLPAWADSGIVDGAIVTYNDPTILAGVLTHYMSHLLFKEFMGALDERTRWIDAGLAVRLERRQAPRSAPTELQKYDSSVPFREMTQLPPLDERSRKNNDWFRQVGDVVAYMLDRGGRLGFADFISELRGGASLDESVRRGFPQLWDDMSKLEAEWNENR
jgi:hypothetical protein